MGESPAIALFVFDLVLFREVEQLILNCVFHDTRENTAVRDLVEYLIQRLVVLSEERRHELFVSDFDLAGFRVLRVFELIL